MKNVSSTFKENIKKYGRQIDAKVKFRDVPQLHLTYNEESRNIFDKESDIIYSNVSPTKTVLDTGVRINYNYMGGTPVALFDLGNLSDFLGKTVRVKTTGQPSGENTFRVDLYVFNADVSSRVLIKMGDVLSEGSTLIEYTLNNSYDENYTNFGVALRTLNTTSTEDYIDYTDLIVTVDNEDMSYTPYDPHGGQYYLDGESTQETRSGKNKFDNNLYTNQYTQNGITTKPIENGFNISGTATNYFAWTDTTNNYYPVDLSKGNYRLSVEITNNLETTLKEDLGLQVYLYNKDKTLLGSSNVYPYESRGWELTEKASYIRIANYRLATGVEYNYDIKLQIEEGTTATPYEAYGAMPSPEFPSPIINKYKAGTYKTYINNKWYYITIAEDLKSVPNGVADRLWLDVVNESVEIVKNIDIDVFDGSDDENWTANGSNQGYGIVISGIGGIDNATEIPVAYCNRLKIVKQNDIYTGAKENVFSVRGEPTTKIYMRIDSAITTVADFKTWLSTHNTEVQYQLAEAGSIECGLSDDGIYREGMPYEEITATKEDINSIVPWFKASLFKTVMNVLEIDSNIEIKPTTKISAEIGVKFGDSPYEYVKYNDYIVYSCERQEDTESYKIVAYDKMVESMIDYNMAVTYPITVRDYLIAVFDNLGWDTDNIPETFINSTKEIQSDIHSGINYTYRDVLDELATITGSFILIKNGIPTLGYIIETNETIDEEYLSQDDVTIGEKYFINSLVFSRAEESDNIYRKDDTSIEEKGLHEFRIADNQILSTNNRDIFIDELFNYLKTLEFHIFDVKSTGIMIFDAVDKFQITAHNNTYPVVFLNNEITVDQDIEEHLYCDEPEETETDYKSADSTDKRINKTYILVDKQNQTITNVVEKQMQVAQEVNNNYQEITQKLNDYATVESVTTVSNKVETLQSSTDYYIGVTEDIQENGVTKVHTEKGFTFDDEGLTIDETSSKTKSNLDTDGLEVLDKTGASEQELLKAGYDADLGETIVKSKNMVVEKYLTIGANARFEDYVNPVLGGKGTGVFNL